MINSIKSLNGTFNVEKREKHGDQKGACTMSTSNLRSDRKAVHRGLINRQKWLLMMIGIFTLLLTLVGYGEVQAHTAVAIATGGSHTCAVMADGTVECWGYNNDGQLGDGTTIYSNTPVVVSGISSAVRIAAGDSHTCAVLADGTVKCWGSNGLGQLGDGTTASRTTPVAVSGITTAVGIAAGDSHSCAVLNDGTAKCWGYNGYGQLGDGTTTYRTTPVTVSGLSLAATISAGYGYTCTMLTDGTAKCWGRNIYGQLGDGSTTNQTTPVSVSGISTSVAIAAGDFHSCAVLADGSVKCWGYWGFGPTPVAVSGINTAVTISAGYSHTCAVLVDGTAKCWGYNNSGQLGDGSTTNRTTPVAVSGITTAVGIAAGGMAGGSHTCVVLADGSVQCWGYNVVGQLGDGTISSSTIPVGVSGVNTAVVVAAGGYHTCAMLAGGTVKCWGWNGAGQLGDGTTSNRITPVTVSGITTAVAIAAGYRHTCAVMSDGTVKCWGDNSYGQLGDGTTSYRFTPVTVSGITTATAIMAGVYHTCAVLTDGTVKCWGYNGFGGLGDGTTTNRTTPVSVSGITTAVAIAAGYGHTCAVMADGTTRCWGYNVFGQLGDGTTTNRTTPVAVSGINTAVKIAAGYAHTCVVLADRSAKCWGDNGFGKLGDGTTTIRTTPVTVSGITTAVVIAAGNSHTCAVLADGTVKCWGYNNYGQLGDGTTTYRTTPVTVSVISMGTAITAGWEYHTCTVLADGSAQCWGHNNYGQLARPYYSVTPVTVLFNLFLSYSSEGGYSSDGVNPDTGNSGTSYVYKVVYTDAHNTAPTYVRVHIDGDTIGLAMSLDTSAASTLHDGNYANGEQYFYTTTLGAGNHNYYFTASNGTEIESLPFSGALSGPTVSALTITTTSLPNGTVGIAYSSTLSASGGTPPFTWNIPSGLPPGLTLNTSTGGISGTPTTGGIYGFTASVTDSALGTISKALSITINANQPPVANNQTISTAEDTSLTITLTGSDLDGDPLSFSVFTGPSNGTLSGTAPNLTYTPNANFNGSDSFTFRVNDGLQYSNTATVSITVTAVNDPPVLASIGNRTVAEGATLNVGVSATDADGTTPTLSATGLPAFCSFTDNLNGTGTLICTPGFTDAGLYTGLTITASDGFLADSKTFSLTVTNVNRAPTLNTIGAKSVNENTNLNFTISGSDPDGDAITYSASGLPAGATFNTSTRVFDWTPSYSQSGSYNVTFTVSDGSLSASEVVTITVNNVNRAPVLTTIGNRSAAEGATLNVGVSATDADGTTPALSATGLPAFCSFTDNLNGTGTLVCTPGQTAAGTYPGITVTASDGSLTSSETITLTVTAVNVAPVINPIGNRSVAEGATLNVGVSASDADGTTPALSATGLPAFCSFTNNLNGTGTLACSPGQTAAGTYPGITITASDGSLTNSETITLTVTAVNVAPVINPIGNQTVAEGATLNVGVSASDADGTTPALSATGLPAFCSFTNNLNGTGTLACTPGQTAAGTYSGITITASDGSLTNSETITLMVTAVNVAPVLNPIGNRSVAEGATLNVGVSATDADGTTPAISATGLPAFCSFTDNLNGTGTLACAPGQTNAGTYPGITVTASDGSLTDFETITLTVTAVNVAPVLASIGNRSVAEGANLNVGVSATDADGTIPALSATGLPAFCSFTDNLNGTGMLTCAPGQTAAGTYPGITVTASDGSLTDFETITLTVTAVNVAPILNPIGNQSMAEGATLNVGVSASDADGTIPTLSATGLPTFCSFTDNLNGTGTLVCTPGFTDANTYTGLTVTATDGSLTDSETFSLTVSNVNRAPVLNPIGNQTIAEGGTLSVSVTASDPDGNAVTLTASGLPSFCGFTDNLNNTGTLTCTPGFTDSGVYPGLTITASDGLLADSETFSLTVTGVNRAPVVASIADQSVNEGVTLNVPVTASDPDGNAVTLTASGLPGFCGFTDNLNSTGTVTCTPGYNDGGVYTGLTVTASDGVLTGSGSFNLTVNGVNRAPVVAPIANQSVGEGATLNLSVTVSDLDGDSLTLSVTGLPAFCSFTDNLNNTGSLTCTPGFTDAGVYSGITITANDGIGGTGSDSFNLTVTGVNRAPTLNPIGAKGVNEGSLLSFTVSGSDPDGDSLTFSVTGTPAGASFNPVSRTFSWTPDYTQSGLYSVTFSVSDGSLTDFEVVSITVNNVNAPPVLSPIGAQTAFEGGTLNVTVTASDPDGGSLTLTATGLPAFCGFTNNLNNTGTLTCTPGFTAAGTYLGLTVTVSDGVLTDSESFTLTVSGVNAAPVLNPIGSQTVNEGATLNVTITASDADGDSLTFAATGLPAFCSLTNNLNNTGTLTCTPGFTNAGVYTGLTVTVSDGILGDSEGFTLTVNNINRAPILAPIGNRAVDEGVALNVLVSASDPDGGSLTFGATGLPSFCGFTNNLNNTGNLACSPGYADAGVYTGLTIIVNDGTLTDSETFSLTVNNVSPAIEVCDGIDNNLNGQIDEGFPDTDGDGQADCVDTDDDNDGYSDATEIAAGSDPLNAASTPEVCDGIDNDLNSGIDEGFPAGNTSCGSDVNVV
ncbi:MAG: tandem-95 repeat protein, partial [Nitrospirae bacterium]|nr:tandem-95 repeat protein [Nitrospirota bacterium]